MVVQRGLLKTGRFTGMIMTRLGGLDGWEEKGTVWDQNRKRAGDAWSYGCEGRETSKSRHGVEQQWAKRGGKAGAGNSWSSTTLQPNIVCSFHCQIIDCYNLNEWWTIVRDNRFSPNHQCMHGQEVLAMGSPVIEDLAEGVPRTCTVWQQTLIWDTDCDFLLLRAAALGNHMDDRISVCWTKFSVRCQRKFRYNFRPGPSRTWIFGLLILSIADFWLWHEAFRGHLSVPIATAYLRDLFGFLEEAKEKNAKQLKLIFVRYFERMRGSFSSLV